MVISASRHYASLSLIAANSFLQISAMNCGQRPSDVRSSNDCHGPNAVQNGYKMYCITAS